MLRREFGIGAYEAEEEVFGWEREMLISRHVEILSGKGSSGDSSGDLSAVPDELRGV